MNSDMYRNFQELQENEKGNYKIECIDRGSNITVVAPHGGCIEPKTSIIAKEIASNKYNFYSFIAKRKKDCFKYMHITSHKYNEPRALELVKKSEIVIVIHGCSDIQDNKDYGKHIFIGGLDKILKYKLKKELINIGLSVGEEKFFGTEFNNICNKGKTKQGIQFELTKSFRNDEVYCKNFIFTIREVLINIKNSNKNKYI